MNLIDLIKQNCKDGYFAAEVHKISPLMCTAEESGALFQAFYPRAQFRKWQFWLPEPFILLAKDQGGLVKEYGKYNFFVMHYVPKKRRAIKGMKSFYIKNARKQPFLASIGSNSCIYFECTGGEKNAGRTVIMPLLYGPKQTMQEVMAQFKNDPKSVFDVLQPLTVKEYDGSETGVRVDLNEVRDNTKWIHIYDLLTKQTMHKKYENPKFEV